MREPGLPKNEQQRLERLLAYDVLDTMPEQVYDDIVALAAHICQVPIALVSLVDKDRQWFKARFGLDAPETPRSISFCGHVVESGEMLQVEDSFEDERFFDNPLATGAPHVRSYTGAPLETSGGLVLGTLCVIDNEARKLSEAQVEQLTALSRLVMQQLELRMQIRHRELAEEREAEAARMEALYKRFFDISLDMLCIGGFDGYAKHLNEAWTETLGFTSDELKSKPFIEFVYEEDRSATEAQVAYLASGEKQSVRFRNRYQAKDGSHRWLQWTVAVDLEAAIVIAVARDVSKSVADEADLRTARDVAQQANKSKSTFLAQMSHELRTPLNSVIGFTNLLLKNKAKNLREKDLVYLDRIGSNGKHLLGLINDVLDLSKIEADHTELSRESVDLAALANSVTDSMASSFQEKGNRLSIVVPANVQPLDADPRRLKQILINLLGNANKFTDRGLVEIVVHVDSFGAPARIDVVDTGVGIPKEKLATIFEAFRQVDEGHDRTYEGTGLGLAIARSLCELHGFKLSVASELGAGTTFSIAFSESALVSGHVTQSGRFTPITDEVLSRAVKNSSLVGLGRTVLIVDDDSDTRLLVAKTIEDLGANVVTADTGQRGFEIARAVRPDLIVLDIGLPDVSGTQLLDWLVADPDLADIPTIVHSSFDEQPLERAVAIHGKPLNRETFQQELIKLLSPSLRVLIVEDDAGARDLLQAIVEGNGAAATVTSNGAAGLRALQTQEFDLVLLDLCMPDMSGFQLIEAYETSTSDVPPPIVVCTALDLSDDQRNLLSLSTHAVIEKGLQFGERLEAMVRTLMQREADEMGKR